MSNPTILTVTSVSEVKVDAGSKGEKRNYKTIGFRTPNTKEVSGFQVRVSPKEGIVNAWEKSYLNDKMQFGFDFKVGEAALGNIVTRKVESYPIVDTKTGEERMVDTYTCVVFGDDTDPSFEIEIGKAFKAAGHELAVAEVKKDSIPVASSFVKEMA